jgi:hypothetical protein
MKFNDIVDFFGEVLSFVHSLCFNQNFFVHRIDFSAQFGGDGRFDEIFKYRFWIPLCANRTRHFLFIRVFVSHSGRK